MTSYDYRNVKGVQRQGGLKEKNRWEVMQDV